MENIKTKVCKICQKEKSVSNFNVLKRRPDGLNLYCRECQYLYNKEYQKKNKERLKVYHSTPEYKESRKKCRAKHKKEIAEYNKYYYDKNKEILSERYKPYRKQYWETHKDIQNELTRIRGRERKRSYVILEEKELVENYNLALADNFRGWQRHHRLETHNSDGEKRLVEISPAELKALGMYYNRPAKELIWVTNAEHINLHRQAVSKKCQH